MRHTRVVLALTAGALVTLPAAMSAQQIPSRPAPKATPPQQELDVEELTPGQIRRAQERQRAEEQQRIQDMQRAQEQRRPQERPRAQDREPAAPKSAMPKTPPAAPSTAGRAVACSGAFAKDSSHLKLAIAFNSLNITFAEVDGPDGAKVMASVLFPNDAKRRLEVWWQNEASRSGTYLIVINGKSTWTAPKGLRLGLALAAVEKLNGRPFKLKGFEKDGGSVTDWQGGGLASLPGGCKAGVKFAPDPKAPEAARAETSVGAEFDSSDAAMRGARPAVAEIILGY
jgi:hypothetical protein